jgi:hypothetical protein
MKIFVAATSLRATYGGPAVSVARLAGALALAGADVGLWAADQTATEAAVLPGAAPVPGARVRRLGGTAARALEHFSAPDVIHDNGIWLAHNHALARLAARHAIARAWLVSAACLSPGRSRTSAGRSAWRGRSTSAATSRTRFSTT